MLCGYTMHILPENAIVPWVTIPCQPLPCDRKAPYLQTLLETVYLHPFRSNMTSSTSFPLSIMRKLWYKGGWVGIFFALPRCDLSLNPQDSDIYRCAYTFPKWVEIDVCYQSTPIYDVIRVLGWMMANRVLGFTNFKCYVLVPWGTIP